MEAVGQVAGRFPAARVQSRRLHFGTAELSLLDQTHGTTQRPSSFYRASVMPLHPRSNRGAKRAGGKWHLLLAHLLVGGAKCAAQGTGAQETAQTRSGHATDAVRWHCLPLKLDILSNPLRLGRNAHLASPAQAW